MIHTVIVACNFSEQDKEARLKAVDDSQEKPLGPQWQLFQGQGDEYLAFRQFEDFDFHKGLEALGHLPWQQRESVRLLCRAATSGDFTQSEY